MSTNREKNVIHWFRKGLRLHDNPPLKEAVQGARSIRCIYILEPFPEGISQVQIHRWRFLLNCLDDLDASLRNFNSRLFVLRGQPTDIFPRLFDEWNINTLSFEEDPEPLGKARDAAISALARNAGIELIIKTCHTLYDTRAILEKKQGDPPLTYNTFLEILSEMDLPPKPLQMLTYSDFGNCQTPLTANHDAEYGVPTLEDLMFNTEGLGRTNFYGGETESLTRLEKHLNWRASSAELPNSKISPRSLFPCHIELGPYLTFSCLSPRLLYWKLKELYTSPLMRNQPLPLHELLLWREFFYTIATNNPKFDQMAQNPICIQIPWDNNNVALAKWAEGLTGFPWIDAVMRQLRVEGWVHNLAQESVACFLTRGHLWISWEYGMKVFADLKIDADWSFNAGTWMWLSCSSFFHKFSKWYCPVGFGKKIDPNGDLIRHYIPILRRFPAKYIFEPWIAPERVQRAARCIVGEDYPIPLVNYVEVGKINKERMRQVHRQLTRSSTTQPRRNRRREWRKFAAILKQQWMQHANSQSDSTSSNV